MLVFSVFSNGIKHRSGILTEILQKLFDFDVEVIQKKACPSLRTTKRE
jgi:hypothetical protein